MRTDNEVQKERDAESSMEMRGRARLILITAACAIVVGGCGGGREATSEIQSTRLASTISSTTVDSTIVNSAPASAIPTGYTVINLNAHYGGYRTINSAGHAITRLGGTVFFFDGNATVELPRPTAGAQQIANDLSDTDYVTGSRYEGFENRVFRWHPSQGYVETTQPGTGWGVNSGGSVAARTPNGSILWDGGSSVTSISGAALAINEAGSVAADRFVWINSDGSIPLPVLSGYQYSSVSFINNADEAAGTSCGQTSTGMGFCSAIRWSKAGGVELLPLPERSPGIPRAWPNGINDAGTVIGSSETLQGGYRGFVIRKGSSLPVELARSETGAQIYQYVVPTDINNSEQVVGHVSTGSIALGFIWSAQEGLIDLNTRLINAPAGLVIHQAFQITDNGYIAANSNAGPILLKPGQASNAIPTLGAVSSSDSVAIGVSMSFSVGFADNDTADTHTATWAWGDGTTSVASVSGSGGNGTATGSHTFTQAGVYDVTLTLTDSTGKSAAVTKSVVAYDPAGGFVTGGGWINSPVGAYRADQTKSGRASFGFVSKYKKGAAVPSGETEFVFSTVGLNFFSSQYDWLVIGGARAQYKGVGTINGRSGYKFMLTAVDGNLIAKGTSDRFRIKIWHSDEDGNDVVDYDNQIDTSTVGGNSEGTVIGGGSIVIHK